MSESDNLSKRILESLRLAAQFRDIAADPLTPDHLRASYVEMAIIWDELANALSQEC